MTVSTSPRLFYTTSPMPCPYLPGRQERKVMTELTGPDAVALHDRLSQAGFRRSHAIAYAPVCAGCRACVPIRIPVRQFVPDRTQRRLLRRQAGITIMEVPPQATAEQYELFRRYQASRHESGDMAQMSASDYRAMVEDSPVATSLLEYRDAGGTLVCVSLVDELSDGLSAVYTFFETADPRASFGTFSILTLIEETRRRNLAHLYLGYWVRGSDKMAYKSRFRPAEIMRGGHWMPLSMTAGQS
ncbi:arginyltransferase [Brytella acorum]|uniref:Aspartate/glutamate leucyltransferase n=1 Tax=Brytella acorum TaxID=2959299 RepID=A0AA35V9U2_9PROT|nr:arginyltransferase [Brytella acorum]MDF3624556.1 arginyltransferase [Brytella acorum]CAI9119595.1 arginyltransferase [Brytella acorum]